MVFTRRHLLKLGGLGSAEMVFARLLPPAPAVSPAPAVLDQRYLAHGLNVLCNAHATDAFVAGHAGGAILTAYYLCREEKLEAGTEDVIKGMLDQHYALAADPFPEEEPRKDAIEVLLRSMEDRVEQLCREGHNVIFLALAIKAMHDLPTAATPSRIAALERTIEALAPRIAGKGQIEVPSATSSFSEFVLDEFLGSTEGGPGQGFSGHLLTHGRAILDLRLLGHETFAKKCLNAFQLAVARARPRSPRKAYTEARERREFLRPDGKQYWVRRVAGDMELGHVFKYPYGFFGLRRHSQNQVLNDVCFENSYRLFRS
ncbi:MAG TPA: hypothetical protein VFD82_15490 [Planctomycetota bacterium]|nr:hypothetical protein [Planctomycetota bacterium]